MTDLTELLRAQGLGWSDASKWPIEKREAARKMIAAADIIDDVLAIHLPGNIEHTDGFGSTYFTCQGCNARYPCRTVRTCESAGNDE